jgi:4-diphosphocytidyl-2-C-methyl-D-erythritol kinase
MVVARPGEIGGAARARAGEGIPRGDRALSAEGGPPNEVWRAPAKINLWLAITGRRHDGYHEVDTGLQAIDLADVVTLAPGPDDGVVECRVEGEWASGIPGDEENLAVRAARTLASRTGHALRLRIGLAKGIPPGAGLGGGSSDAAAVLLALARRFAVPDPQHTLHALAAEIGADVAFFLEGGTQRARGIGEDLAPMDPPEERWGILVHPGVAVSTAWAYAAWDEAAGGVADEARDRIGPPADDWRERGNVFEPLVAARHPEVGRAAGILRAGPATVSRLSGSGGAVYALYADEEARDRDLDRVRKAVGSIPRARVWRFATIDHGVQPWTETEGDPAGSGIFKFCSGPTRTGG